MARYIFKTKNGPLDENTVVKIIEEASKFRRNASEYRTEDYVYELTEDETEVTAHGPGEMAISHLEQAAHRLGYAVEVLALE